jgi:hypothetical protein
MKITTLLSIITTTATAFTIDCHYNADERWTSLPPLYTCLVSSSSPNMTHDDRTITAIRGQHHTNFDNDDVHGFYVNGRTMEFFPRHLERQFRQLRAIAFHNTGMRVLHSEDLRPFGERLETIRVSGCEIEVIEQDLFRHNPNLRGIGMHRNRIKFIDGDSLQHLRNLRFLWLEGNDCINQSANDKQGVTALVNEVRKKCFMNFMIMMSYEYAMRDKRELQEELELVRMRLKERSGVDGHEDKHHVHHQTTQYTPVTTTKAAKNEELNTTAATEISVDHHQVDDHSKSVKIVTEQHKTVIEIAKPSVNEKEEEQKVETRPSNGQSSDTISSGGMKIDAKVKDEDEKSTSERKPAVNERESSKNEHEPSVKDEKSRIRSQNEATTTQTAAILETESSQIDQHQINSTNIKSHQQHDEIQTTLKPQQPQIAVKDANDTRKASSTVMGHEIELNDSKDEKENHGKIIIYNTKIENMNGHTANHQKDNELKPEPQKLFNDKPEPSKFSEEKSEHKKLSDNSNNEKEQQPPKIEQQQSKYRDQQSIIKQPDEKKNKSEDENEVEPKKSSKIHTDEAKLDSMTIRNQQNNTTHLVMTTQPAKTADEATRMNSSDHEKSEKESKAGDAEMIENENHMKHEKPQPAASHDDHNDRNTFTEITFHHHAHFKSNQQQEVPQKSDVRDESEVVKKSADGDEQEQAEATKIEARQHENHTQHLSSDTLAREPPKFMSRSDEPEHNHHIAVDSTGHESNVNSPHEPSHGHVIEAILGSPQNAAPQHDTNHQSKLVTSPFSDDDDEELTTVTEAIAPENSEQIWSVKGEVVGHPHNDHTYAAMPKEEEEEVVNSIDEGHEESAKASENSALVQASHHNSSSSDSNNFTSIIENVKSKVHSMISYFTSSDDVDEKEKNSTAQVHDSKSLNEPRDNDEQKSQNDEHKNHHDSKIDASSKPYEYHGEMKLFDDEIHETTIHPDGHKSNDNDAKPSTSHRMRPKFSDNSNTTNVHSNDH